MTISANRPGDDETPVPPNQVSLSPAATLLSDGLSRRWDKFNTRLYRCRSEFSEENIHDLRVSMRRMMAILSMCNAVLPDLKSKGLRRELKNHLDNFDEVRDIQVMLLFVKKNFRNKDGVVPLSTYLSLQEAHHLRQLGFEIGQIDEKALLTKLRVLQSALESTLTGTGVAEQILAVVDEAFADLRWKKVNADPHMPPSVHAMRIAFKKFRYMLEVALPLVPPMPPTRPRVLQRYQGMMGQIQDSTVLLNFLNHFGAENPQFDITPVVEYVIQKRDEQMEYFFARIDHLGRFWRKSAGVRFPWRVPESLPETDQSVEIESE